MLLRLPVREIETNIDGAIFTTPFLRLIALNMHDMLDTLAQLAKDVPPPPSVARSYLHALWAKLDDPAVKIAPGSKPRVLAALLAWQMQSKGAQPPEQGDREIRGIVNIGKLDTWEQSDVVLFVGGAAVTARRRQIDERRQEIKEGIRTLTTHTPEVDN